MQATVVAPSLVWADIWATTLVAMGEEALTLTTSIPGTSGLLVFADRQTHQWQSPPLGSDTTAEAPESQETGRLAELSPQHAGPASHELQASIRILRQPRRFIA